MKRKLILSLLCSLNILLLFGCGKQETTSEDIIEPKELITKINVTSDSLIPEEIEETISENTITEIASKESNVIYEKVNNYYSFPSKNLLVIEGLYDSYVYLEDNQLTTLLSELSNNYVYIFDKEIETDITIYDTLYAESQNSSSTDHLFLTPADLEEDNENDIIENNTDEVEQTEDSNINNIDETETSNEISNSENIELSEIHNKYLFTLYKAKSVSIYNQDQELIIKEATKADDLSFILDTE